ncbi:hypothetical protein ACEQ8H_003395 [Pleosporales sp. CAS-2024a]
MVEVLGLLASAAQLLDQTIGLLGRIRKAHQRRQALPGVMVQHESELKSLQAIIDFIEETDELQSDHVAAELTRLRVVQDKLLDLLKELQPKFKNPLYQFAHQMSKGSSDETRLCSIMNDLAQVKAMLLLRIQVTSVGVMRDVKQGLVANTEVITRVDMTLREQVGDCKGLKIARIIRGRRPSHNGMIPLTAADLECLGHAGSDGGSEDGTLVGDGDWLMGSPTRTSMELERINERNIVKGQAIQINSFINQDTSTHIKRLVINDNIAQDQGIQINHGTTLEVAAFFLEIQGKRIQGSR